METNEILKVVAGSMLTRENFWIVALWFDDNSYFLFSININ